MPQTEMESMSLRTLASIVAEAAEGDASAYDHLVHPDGDAIEPDEDSGSDMQDFIVFSLDGVFDGHLSVDEQLATAKRTFEEARDQLDKIVKAFELQEDLRQKRLEEVCA